MPAKGFNYHRETVINKKFYARFIEQFPKYKDQLDYETFKSVILDSNKEIADLIINDENGVKLPSYLGYIVVTRYKSKKKAADWSSTKKYGKKIYHTNLHTFGFSLKIKWFKAGIATFKRNRIYKFKTCRKVRRAVSKSAKEGKNYLEWKNTDFWTDSKLERTFRKQFNVEN